MIGVSTINIQGYDTDHSVCIQTNFRNIKITSYPKMDFYNFSPPPPKKIPLVTAVDPRGKKEIQIITNTCITHSSDLVLL